MEFILSLSAALESVNWLEWTKTFFDLLKGIAWPLSLLLVVWTFRNEIRDRIKDIVSVGPGGAVLQPQVQTRQAKPPTGLSKSPPHPLTTVQALIAKIDGQLNEVPEEEQVSKLVFNLAEAQIEREFENIFGLIFGSQITALRRLKESGSVSLEDARQFYENEVKPANKDVFANLDFDQWADFLKRHQLVQVVENNRFSLTDAGRDFLSFIDLRKQGVYKGL